MRIIERIYPGRLAKALFFRRTDARTIALPFVAFILYDGVHSERLRYHELAHAFQAERSYLAFLRNGVCNLFRRRADDPYEREAIEYAQWVSDFIRLHWSWTGGVPLSTRYLRELFFSYSPKAPNQ